MLRRTTFFLSTLALAATLSAQSYRLVIPAAGDVAGANGTHFRSDISITNLRDVPQQVRLSWIPRGDAPPAAQVRRLNLAPHATITSANFVAEHIGVFGLGSIEITAVDGGAGNNDDPDGRLYATSRIYSPQPGVAGTVSQSLPALPINTIVHQRLLFTGHRHGGQYRTNLGVVNLLNDVEQTYRVHVSGSVQTALPVQFELKVGPRSMEQVSIDWPEDPQLRVQVEVLPQPAGGVGTLWTAYLSSIDNVTGDSWSTLGVEVGDL